MTTNTSAQNEEISELQIKVAFLEEALSNLSEEFYAQQKELKQVSLTLEAWRDKLSSQDIGEQPASLSIDERPPHY